MAKYQITASRYIDGRFIFASPEKPAIIDVEIPESRQTVTGLAGLTPVEEEDVPVPQKLKPANAGRTSGAVTRQPDKAAPKKPKGEETAPEGGRPSDRNPGA